MPSSRASDQQQTDQQPEQQGLQPGAGAPGDGA
ncbi:MAG: hypothetical protein JWR63_4254, partial [Conexibacter sp.]|nr:hypothetical protein [Conexibacter sp.]